MPAPIILTSSSATNATGTSLQAIRARLAPTLGYYAVGVVTTLAASLVAESRVISSVIQSDQAPPEHLDGLYLYVRNGLEARSQRKVINGAFDGPLGAAVVDTPYASGPLALGTVFELSVLPSESYLGTTGQRDAINLGLEDLGVIDYVSVTATATNGVLDTQYSLSLPYPIKDILAVIYPRTLPNSDARREMPKTWSWDQDAEAPRLSIPGLAAAIGDTFEVRLLRPATTRIKVAGVWGDSTVGLVNEDDACLYDVNTVVKMARPIALERMALLHERGSKPWSALMAEVDKEDTRAAVARFFGSFHGNGAQRVHLSGRR